MHCASSNLQMSFHWQPHFGQSHFHDVGIQDLLHRHEYLSALQDISWTSQNTLYATPDVRHSMGISRMALLLFSVSRERNPMDLPSHLHQIQEVSALQNEDHPDSCGTIYRTL